jgi:hypothetical protein
MPASDGESVRRAVRRVLRRAGEFLHFLHFLHGRFVSRGLSGADGESPTSGVGSN